MFVKLFLIKSVSCERDFSLYYVIFVGYHSISQCAFPPLQSFLVRPIALIYKHKHKLFIRMFTV